MRPSAKYHFTDVSRFEIPSRFQLWLRKIAVQNEIDFSLKYIFCSDQSLLVINQTHLQHNTYTDIITFDLSTTDSKIVGEIYISVDRVKDNANKVGCSFADELIRVMAHGVFHLLGHGDKKEHEALKMRELEGGAIDFVNHVSRETKQ